MKTISPEKYIEGVNSIYVEQPAYELGADGTNGKCDCIGMVRGGLVRAGATEVKGLNGTNYAARHTIVGLQKLKKESQLAVGDIVMKTRDKDDKNMPLPDQYRKGGSDYSQTWGETNFSHIGTVVQVNPIRICHMTSPTAKIDTSISGWSYFGGLPWVKEDAEEDELPDVRMAEVWAESGKTVKMRDKPSTLCRLYWDVPIGSQVVVTEPGDKWTRITWNGRNGYMQSQFIRSEGRTYTVIISGQSLETAKRLCEEYENATMEEEVG